MIQVILVGDFNREVIAHGMIPQALALTAKKVGVEVGHRWMATDAIGSMDDIARLNADAVWCVPGSPYRSMEGALAAIRFARENKIPFLGTCGGFQHALIEYARNVLELPNADHAESNPTAEAPVIAKMQCSLINRSEVIRIRPETALARIYEAWKATEPYQCSYGLNPAFRNRFESVPMVFTTPLHFTAFNDELDVRAFELTDHPFFIGTLFQPERSAAMGQAHPLVCALLKAARG